jgi:hypothetical protein
MAEDVHMRDTIKYSDYKQFGSTTKIIYDGQDISNKGAAPDSKPPDAKPQPPK